MRRLRDEVDDLERRLLSMLDGGARAERVGWRELRRAIPDDAAFIDLLVFDRHRAPEAAGDTPPGALEVVPSLMAYVVRPGTDRVMRRVVGRLDELEADVARIVGGVSAGRGRPALPAVLPSGREAASALYRRLFEPYEELLEGVEHVIVSPDRFVGAVPFGALRDGEGRYLVERFRFSYVSDAGLLCELAATDRRDGGGGVLAVGDVDYGRGDDWAPLPGTSRELDDLARRFADVEVLRGADATAAALRERLPAARIAHLATHGFFVGRPRPAATGATVRRGLHEALLEDAPPGARAGLVLAGGNDRDADAVLSADEVGWLPLSGVDLVVLSACSTGLGTAFGGEGMQSLQRAFHVAGARTVVASLWKVDDAATADLMKVFYRARFDEGMSTAEALRTARLDLLERNRAAFGDARPATWGAFVLSGDWR
ncbi:MAG: CHAT domain-containing protein [Planctomycetota bacterium JB042]